MNLIIRHFIILIGVFESLYSETTDQDPVIKY